MQQPQSVRADAFRARRRKVVDPELENVLVASQADGRERLAHVGRDTKYQRRLGVAAPQPGVPAQAELVQPPQLRKPRRPAGFRREGRRRRQRAAERPDHVRQAGPCERARIARRLGQQLVPDIEMPPRRPGLAQEAPHMREIERVGRLQHGVEPLFLQQPCRLRPGHHFGIGQLRGERLPAGALEGEHCQIDSARQPLGPFEPREYLADIGPVDVRRQQQDPHQARRAVAAGISAPSPAPWRGMRPSSPPSSRSK